MRLRHALLAGLVALGVAAGSAAATAKSYTVGYSQFWGTNPFLVTMANGARKAADEWKAKGVDINMVLTNGGDTDTTKQVGDLEDLDAQGVNGLLLFPGDSIVRRRAGEEHLQQEEHPRRHHRHRPAVGQVGHVHHHRQHGRRRAGGRADGQERQAGRQRHRVRPCARQRQRPEPRARLRDKAKELGLERAAAQAAEAEPGGRAAHHGGHAGLEPGRRRASSS